MIRPLGDRVPVVAPTAFVEDSAQVVGEVTLGDRASIWYNATLRGDVGPIRIGARSNVQDNAVVHGTKERGTFATVGEDVTVGHGAILHGCTIEDRVLVGMGSIILDGAVVSSDSIVGAGSLVTMGARFPPRSMILGRPAKAVRPLRDDEVASILGAAGNYLAYTIEHRAARRP